MTATSSPMARGLRIGCVMVILLGSMVGAAWAFWTADSVPGGNGASAAAVVNQGSTPTVTVSGRSVTVNWTATTLSTGDPVTGYVIRRYNADTLVEQPVGDACRGTITTTRCTETAVTAGRWVYSVTPVVGAHWVGAESVRSSPASVAGPSLSLSSTRIRPGTSASGTAAGFVPGTTLRFHLDSPTGPELSGTLDGTATPAPVPFTGGGAIGVTVPMGTSDGNHTIYAVTSPNGDAASAAIVVDGTPPPAPTLTQNPGSTSGDTVTFAFTEPEESATPECSLDTAAFTTCRSPIQYSGLAEGQHTFRVRAVDTVGNISPVTSYTWTVNLTVPTVEIGFPAPRSEFNDSGFNAGCGTLTTGDVCGIADDDILVTTVSTSLRQHSTGRYWNGVGFTFTTETFNLAIGTADWTYGIASSSLPEGEYTLRARASDGSNVGFDVTTFTIDRTAPPAPTLTGVPPSPSGSSATFTFSTADTTAGLECRLDSGAWAACASPRQYTGLTNGSHTLAIRAVDPAGNVSPTSSHTWTVDGTPPTGSATFPTASQYNQAGWTAGCGTPTTGDICGTAGDVGSTVTKVEVSMRRASTSTYWNGTGFLASGETWLTANGTTSWSFPFSGTSFPGDGTYSLRWRITDAAGNATTGGVDLTIDTTPPPAPKIVQAPPDPSGSSAQFDFTVSEAPATTDCRLDGAAWSACTAPVSYSNLAEGTHTFDVRAVDQAGNTSTATSHTWTVDVGLPTVNIGFPNGGRSYNNATFAAGCDTPGGDICGTASDPQGNLSAVAVSIQRQSTLLFWNGSSFNSTTEVFLPASGLASWSFPIAATSFPADGAYTVRARATDRTGLNASDAVTITIDRTAPPAPTFISGPTGTTRGDDTFTFTGESGATFQCRLDAGAWQACTSPRSLTGLTDGNHTFDVRAIDQAGNISAPTSRTWTVDRTAPTIATTFPGSGGSYNNTGFDAGCVAGTGDVCGTASDARSGVAKVELSMQRAGTGLYLSGGTFGSTTENWLTANGTTSWAYPLAASTFPADDTYILSARATDGVGNTTTTTTTFRIDRTRPSAAGFGTTPGLTQSKLEAGDTFTLTYSEPMSADSIIADWDGTIAQNVVVRASGTGSRKDTLRVYDASNTTLLPLGTINLNRTDYVNGTRTFGASGTRSTITQSGNSFTITLGTLASGQTLTAAGPANVIWTPATGATDVAGNGAFSSAFIENDNDRDF